MQLFSVDAKFLNGRAGISSDARSLIEAFQALGWHLDDRSAGPFTYTTASARKVRDFAVSLGVNPFRIKSRSEINLSLIPQISGCLPSLSTNSIIRVHDLFPLTNPEWFTRNGVSLFKKTFEKIDFNKSFFLSNSLYTQKVLHSYADITPDRSNVLRCYPKDLKMATLCGECDGCKFEFSFSRYVLNVNTIEPRKNIQFLIRNWMRLGFKEEENLHLVIVGKMGWKIPNHLKQILKVKNSDFTYIGRVCDGSLHHLYTGAMGYVSASLNEGFNIPVEQARLYSLPLLISDIPVHRELYSNGTTIFFNPANDEDFAKKLLTFAKYPPRINLNVQYFSTMEADLADALAKWGI
jgi:glycosyltransferase involved in cell wall biosynthesis